MASFAIVLRLVVCLPVLRCGIDCVATAAATVPAQETCTVSTVTEGEFAVMTFMLRSGMDTASKTFFAHLRRRDRKMTDIITCTGLKVSCNVKDGHPMFQVEGNLKENILKVRISNMSRELEDTYVLQVFFNGTAEPSSSCALTMDTRVNATLVTGAGIDDENGSYGWIAAPIVVLIAIAIAILFFFRKKIQHCWSRHVANTDRTPKSNERSANPLLPNTQPQPCSQANVDHPSTSSENADQGETTKQSDGACADQQRLNKKDKTDSLKRSNRKTTRKSKASLQPAGLPAWVFTDMSEQDAKDRLLSEGKHDFLVFVTTDKKMFISVKLDPDRVEKYKIHHGVKGYWVEPHRRIVGLSDLVDHYMKSDGVWGHTLGNRIDANTSAT